ncbi:hypothetical protein ACPPVT_12665 [Angustibacter sp. McL0619]|uniref:hypothetical protein n=1 Tax=Angustibacter sp. McL0619 TaxID=3415676 RepID=UPI003CED93CD
MSDESQNRANAAATGAVPAQTSNPEPARPSRGRGIAAVVCVVLAALLTTPAAVAYWGQRTLNDTQRFVDTVGPLVNSPEVQDALATTVTDAIEQQVDVEAILNNAFAGVITDRPRLQQLAGPIDAAVDGLIERQVRTFIASDEFADLWVRLTTRTQQAMHRVLTGEATGAVSVQGDQLVLDVDDVIAQVKQRLVDRGLTIVQNVPVPQTDRQIVLLEAPQVKQLRTIYAFSNPVARWLLPVVGLLYLAAFLLARRRPRMTVAIGAVVACNALLIALALSVGEQLFVNQLAGTTFGPASRVFYDTLLAFLQRGQQVLLAFGLVLVMAGWFAGSNRYGTAVRSTVVGGLEGIGSRLGAGAVAGAGRWVLANIAWLRAAIIALGIVGLLWGNDVSLSRVWWSLAIVVVLLACLQVLVGAGRQAHSSDPTAGPSELAQVPLGS